jgi:uncharacterized membrane protein YcaP (DUF421 family)
MFTDFLGSVFGGDFPRDPLGLHQVAARAALVYVVGLIIVRAGKSRLISRATSLDIILGFILGSLLSRGITGHASLSGTAMASATLVGVHWSFTAMAFRSHWFGNLIKGHSYPVVRDGRPCQDNLRRAHISAEDLLEELRLHGVDSLRLVASAYKERNGEVSVIKKDG